MEVFLWIWFLLSLPAIYFMWKGVTNLLSKNETYEDWILEFGKEVQEISAEIDRLDHAGTFRGDDEVGYFFTEFKKIIDRLKDFEIIDEPQYIFDSKRGIIYGPETEE